VRAAGLVFELTVKIAVRGYADRWRAILKLVGSYIDDEAVQF